jgi:hypothetical protein
MRLKKLIIGTLVVSMIAISMITPTVATATTVDSVSSATTANTDTNSDSSTITPTATPTPTVTATPVIPKSFSDVKKENKYYTAVTKLAKLGAIGGYADGTFKPKTNITNAKFICILMRTIDKSQARATKGNDYDATVLQAAFDKGIVNNSELKVENYNKGMTKGNMALWLTRAIEYYENKTELKKINNIDNLIADFDKIPAKYQDEVIELYSEGIVTSENFSYSAKVTRGTAVTLILKAVSPSYRKDMSKVTIPTDQDTANNADAKTLKATDANRGLAHIGDTWVSKSGTKTKITGIKWGDIEVPGYGQGIDFYTGLVYGDETLKNGDIGDVWGTDSTYMGQKLTVAKDSVNGKTFSYFRDQWIAIMKYEGNKAKSIKSPKDGQMCGYFTQYSGKLKMWVFIGPDV